jgi:eukaryotic-like serine/threonine-protein kinase
MGRRLLRALGLVVYVGVVAVVFVLSGYVSFSLFVRSGATPVPGVEGMAQPAAAAVLADKGLRLRHDEGGDLFHETIPPGHVVRQEPRGGSLVKRGSDVEVALSRGPFQATVPDVTGVAESAARITLAAAGLPLGPTANVYADDQTPGLVVLQDPPAGTLVQRATPVHLFVALERLADTYVMPDLVYRGYDEVRGFFDQRGFRLGSVKFEPYEGIAQGVVLRQFPLAGHPLRHHDAIALVVAAAPEAGEAAAAEGELR